MKRKVAILTICVMLSFTFSTDYVSASSGGILATISEIVATTGATSVSAIIGPLILALAAIYGGVYVATHWDEIMDLFNEWIGNKEISSTDVRSPDQTVVHDYVYSYDSYSKLSDTEIVVPESVLESANVFIDSIYDNYSTVQPSYIKKISDISEISTSSYLVSNYSLQNKLASILSLNDFSVYNTLILHYYNEYSSVCLYGVNTDYLMATTVAKSTYNSNFIVALKTDNLQSGNLTNLSDSTNNTELDIDKMRYVSEYNNNYSVNETYYVNMIGKPNLGDNYTVDSYHNGNALYCEIFTTNDDLVMGVNWTDYGSFGTNGVYDLTSSEPALSIKTTKDTLDIDSDGNCVVQLDKNNVKSIEQILVNTGVSVIDGIGVGEYSDSDFADNIQDANQYYTTDQPVLDFLSGFFDSLLDLLKEFVEWLFVPSDDFMETYVRGVIAQVESNVGILMYPATIMVQFFNGLYNCTSGDCIFHIPQLKYLDYVIYGGMDYNVTQAIKRNTTFSQIYQYWMYFTDFIMIMALVNLARKKYDDILKGSGAE